MTKMAEQKMPVVFPKIWIGLSSAVPESVRRNGVPFTPIDSKSHRARKKGTARVQRIRS